MDVYEQAAENIIKEQENIIGPLALEQAQRVEGLEVNAQNHQVRFSGNKQAALGGLVDQYRQLFGQTSVEVCKEAAHSVLAQLPAQEIPLSLR